MLIYSPVWYHIQGYLTFLNFALCLSFLRRQRFWWERKKVQVKGEGQGQEERTSFNVPDKWRKRLKKQEERWLITRHIKLWSTHSDQCCYPKSSYKYMKFSWKSLHLFPKQLPNQTVMTVKRRQRQPNQRRNPQPAQRPCSKHQETRTKIKTKTKAKTKTRRQRRKAGLLLTLSSFAVTHKYLMIFVLCFRKGRW